MKSCGKDAPKKLAIVRSRLDRKLGAGDMEAASAWFEGLPSQDAAQVMKVLAG